MENNKIHGQRKQIDNFFKEAQVSYEQISTNHQSHDEEKGGHVDPPSYEKKTRNHNDDIKEWHNQSQDFMRK